MLVWFMPHLLELGDFIWNPATLPLAAPLVVEASDTILQVKKKIRSLRKPPNPPIRLYIQLWFGKRWVQELEDCRTLPTYYIQDGDIIVIVAS